MTGGNKDHRNFLVVAGIAIVVIVVSFMLRPGQSEHATDTTDRPSDSATSDAPEPAAKEKHRKKHRKADAAAILSKGQSQFGDLPGWGGEGRNMNLPKHTLTLTLTSPGSVGFTAWIIPTASPDKGTHQTTSSSWSMTTTVYGKPDYAAVFAQADSHGTPVTCTITVDGRVTERRTTQGPYGAMWCKG